MLAEGVHSAMKSLKNAKSQGLDGIYAEHLKHAAGNLHVLLSMVLNSMLINADLPPMLMNTRTLFLTVKESDDSI